MKRVPTIEEARAAITARVRRYFWSRGMPTMEPFEPGVWFDAHDGYTYARISLNGQTWSGFSKRRPGDPYRPLLGCYLALQRATDAYLRWWKREQKVRHMPNVRVADACVKLSEGDILEAVGRAAETGLVNAARVPLSFSKTGQTIDFFPDDAELTGIVRGR